ncbi:hypothetical protein FACS1894187_09340 [Synergistales bacterium]|nr:hypothetical protein FACS1894187_09340 [Synergistales bacterium]
MVPAHINISHYVEKTEALGPFTRSAFWVQGCPFRCLDCLSPDMREQGGEWLSAAELADVLLEIYARLDIEGVTVSGGEPFAQSAAVADVIQRIRKRADYGVIVYTGFTIEELRASGGVGAASLLKEADILIDGRYVAELDDGRPYRGSSNQRLLMLSERYKGVFDSYYNGSSARRVEINVGPGRATLVGVPSKEAIDVWRKMRASTGRLAQIPKV